MFKVFQVHEALASCAIEGNRWAQHILELMRKENRTEKEQQELDEAMVMLLSAANGRPS